MLSVRRPGSARLGRLSGAEEGKDLGQRHDLADVVGGFEPLLLETFVIGLSIRGQRQEAQHQTLFPGTHTLGEQALGVLGILDIQVTRVAAGVTGDELGVEVDCDAVGIEFDGQATVSVGAGDGIVIGVDGDAELARGARGRGAR
jgi:hypothetical protein